MGVMVYRTGFPSGQQCMGSKRVEQHIPPLAFQGWLRVRWESGNKNCTSHLLSNRGRTLAWALTLNPSFARNLSEAAPLQFSAVPEALTRQSEVGKRGTVRHQPSLVGFGVSAPGLQQSSGDICHADGVSPLWTSVSFCLSLPQLN